MMGRERGERERDGFLSETFFSPRLTRRRQAGREGQSVSQTEQQYLPRRRRMLKGFFGFAFPSQSKPAICQRDFAKRFVYLSVALTLPGYPMNNRVNNNRFRGSNFNDTKVTQVEHYFGLLYSSTVLLKLNPWRQ